VQHDEPRHDALARQIDDGRAGRRGRARRVAQRGDVAVADHDRLVLARGGAGAVDDPPVDERDDRRLHLDVRGERIRGWLRQGRPEGLHDDYKTERRDTHAPYLPHPPYRPDQPDLPCPPYRPDRPLHRITSAAIAPRSSLPWPLAIASSIALAMLGRTVIG
jgi:hypothetical protein